MKKFKLIILKNDGSEYKFNKGKPFTLPVWTVDKHEDALDECLENTQDMKPEEKDKELRYYIILRSLREIDDSITYDLLKIMHPEDLFDLFEAVYSAGKRGILFQE